MKLLVDIPDELKKMVDMILILPPQVENDLISAIRHGTPLPEHHGRLIDAEVACPNHTECVMCPVAIECPICAAPTIIEATEVKK